MDEAAALANRFKAITNRAKFSRDFSVPGGDAMIYQHINGLKPISLDAAVAYATGFGCSLAEISPSQFERLKKVAGLILGSDASAAESKLIHAFRCAPPPVRKNLLHQADGIILDAQDKTDTDDPEDPSSKNAPGRAKKPAPVSD